jgi:recombination protein RecA
MVAALVLPLRRGVIKAPELPSRDARGGLPRGRLIELTGGADAAATSAAVQILLASQREGDPVVWVQPRGGSLYPPDLAAAGIDLASMLVVHVPKEAGSGGMPKAAELALRTGAFGAIALDLTSARPPRGEAWLGRLASLAREHDCRCVLLGPADASASLGPLVSTRLRAHRRRVRPGRYRVETEVLKDKAGVMPSLGAPEVWRGPEGMP